MNYFYYIYYLFSNKPFSILIYIKKAIINRVFFVSKLTREEKIEIFERRKMGETISSLTKAFNIRESNIKYLIALIKKHGYNILREDKK